MTFLEIAARMLNPDEEVYSDPEKIDNELRKVLMSANRMITFHDASDSLRSPEAIASIIINWMDAHPTIKPYKE